MREFAKFQMNSWWRERVAEGCLAVVLAPAFAWMAPFTSDDQVFLARLGYWVAMLSCWFLMAAVTERATTNTGVLRNARPVIREMATVAGTSLLLIPVVGAATHALTGWQVTIAEVVELFFQIAVLGFLVTLIGRSALVCRFGGGGPLVVQAFAHEPSDTSGHAPLIHQPPIVIESAPDAALEPEAPVAPNRLLNRLPAHVRGRIIALEMEDHYVRVHTDRGSALVLLRLSDAIAEVASIAGRQVHRSWWAADDAIEHFERVGRAGQIRLGNGLIAPVSQRYLKDIEARYFKSAIASRIARSTGDASL